MTPSARFAAALELLDVIEKTPRPADALVSAYYRARRFIGAKDRAEISAFVYAALRHQARLSWWLERLGAAPTARGRALVHLRLVEEKSRAYARALFQEGRYAPPALSPEEEKLLRALDGHTLFHPEMPKAVAGECPSWAFPGLSARFGLALEQELGALLKPAPLDLRVNPLRIARDEAIEALRGLGLEVEAAPYSPWGLRVRQRLALGSLALLKQGAIEIQDEGSQLVAFLLDPHAGERVCDFCAGAGGKTLALSALMENKGRISACDVLGSRLARSAERFRRAGLHNIETRPLSSERDPWVKRHKGAFDRVLVDAPCSGSGTWRRNPDARWKALGPGLDALVPLQASILDSAARLVKPGGRLVYATCSLLPEENERQIEKFLDNHPDFALLPMARAAALPARDSLPSCAGGDFLSLTPARHDTDGFFAAALMREGAAS